MGYAAVIIMWGRRHASLLVLLALTSAVYLWDLDRSGWANGYYSAAAQAGTKSWTAFLFGGLDPGGFITVDKPPLALWPMVLGARLLGVSSWSLLIPQALEGVASVGLLYATVRRSTGSNRTGLVAGTIFALSPVAVLIFRYNNPDALLTLLLVFAAYATTRSVGPPTDARWLALAGATAGLAFNTKMLEAFVVLPALVLVYLIFADRALLRRLRDVTIAGLALACAAGWWLVLVWAWPGSIRPWIGGSPANSAVELTLGYNGAGRLIGASNTSAGIGGGWRATNLARIGRTELGAEIGWLFPAAILIGLVALTVLRRTPAQRSERAALTMWLIWLGTTSSVFAAMTGIFHSYYTVIQAPAIAAVAAIGGSALWARRDRPPIRRLLIGCAITTMVVELVIVAVSTRPIHPWIPLVVGASALIVMVLASRSDRGGPGAILGLTLTASLVGQLCVDLGTVTSPHVGSGPMAGQSFTRGSVGFFNSDIPATAPSELVAALRANDSFRWSAATDGARPAAALELASGTSVMGIGGYKGTDPTPTLNAFRRYVARGEVRYYVTTDTTFVSPIHSWVTSTFVPSVVGGLKVYDLGGDLGPGFETR